MNKELLEKIDNMIERIAMTELHTGKSEDILIDKNTLLDIKKELELESIDNAKPSEALKCVDDINADLVALPKHIEGCDDIFDDYLEDISIKTNSIKQALLKAQEQEKVLNIIKEKNVDIKLLKKSTSWLDYYTRVKHKTGETTELTDNEYDLLKRWLG